MLTFRVYEDEYGMGPVLVPTSTARNEIQALLSSNGSRALRLTESMGWSEENLSVLGDLDPKSLDSLEVYSTKVRDISEILRFRDLRKLGLSTAKLNGLSIFDFPKLAVLFLKLSGEIPSISFPKSLEVLKLEGFGGYDLKLLPAATNLKRLLISARKLETLQGLERFSSLLSLTILEARSLRDISEVEKLEKLLEFVLNGASRIGSIDSLSSCGALKKVELDRCGKIESLRALASLSSLEELILSEGTDLLDGDLSPLIGLLSLKRFVLTPRPWYSPKPNSVREAIEQRQSARSKP